MNAIRLLETAGPAAKLGRHSFVRFAGFGLLGLAFDVSLLALLVAHTDLHQTAAVAIAFATTYLLNFFLNRRFSFVEPGARTAPGRLPVQLARFAPQVGLDLVLTLTAVDALTGIGVAVIAARVLAGGTNAAVNYSMYRWWTFRPGRPGRKNCPDDPHTGRSDISG